MPNKNYFAQLSLKQKAELFNIYARGGYTSLSEIENHYNSLFNDDVEPVISIPESDNKEVVETLENNYNEQSFELPSLADYFYENPNMFDMGGDTDGNDNGVNEYISKKIAEMRARALEKSRTAIAPYKAPGSEKDKERSISHFNAWARTYRDAGMRALVDKPAFVLFENPAYGFIDDEGDIIYDEMNGDNVLLAKKMQARSDPNKARIALNMMAKDFEDEAHAVAAGGIPVYGSNCAYNVTTWHGPQYSDASNVHFANEADNGKNGWVRIPVSEAREGDTIQGKDEFGVPGHMMLLDGFDNSYGPNTPLFNYSRGGNESYDLVKHGHYVNPEDFNDRWFNAFRFVGTPADSLRWKQEYENMNQKNNGGILRSFDAGGNIILPQKYLDYFSKFKDYDDWSSRRGDDASDGFAESMAQYYYNNNVDTNTLEYFKFLSGPHQDYYNLKSKYQYDDKYNIDFNLDNSYRLKSLDKNGNPTNKHTMRMSPELLDYIYDESVRAGVNPKRAIALATNESNLGNARAKNGKINLFDLFSYWVGTGSIIYPNSQTNIKKFNDKLRRGEKLTNKDVQEIRQIQQRYTDMAKKIHAYNGDSIIGDAVRYFDAGKYPGAGASQKQKDDYEKLVMSRFDELMNDQRFVKWWNEKQKSQK